MFVCLLENRSKDNPKLTAELRKLRKTKLGHWIVCIAPDAMYNIQKVVSNTPFRNVVYLKVSSCF